MSTTLISSLDTLPIELIHHIFNNLDAQTIVCSLCCAYQRFYNIVNTYDSYELNFDGMSKPDFDLICRSIQPKNVIPLTLSNTVTTPGQIPLFLSFVHIEQFTRLRWLTLFEIQECHLNRILKSVVSCSLISLSIQQNSHSDLSYSSNALLSTIIEQPSLRKLSLNLWTNTLDKIRWPIQCTIQNLTLFNCHLDHLLNIFRHFQCLRALSIKSCDLDNYSFKFNTLSGLVPMRQLRSLVIEDASINMRNVKAILSNTSSLTHLRLTGSTVKLNFQWEQLIQTKLPLLIRFEFFFYKTIVNNNRTIDLETILVPFRTPFWLDIKHWFVTCEHIKCLQDHNTNRGYYILLYSIPVCTPYFEYVSDSNMVTSSTSTQMKSDVAMMDNVRTVYCETGKVMAGGMTTKTTSQTHLIRKASGLKIRIDSAWSPDFIQHLSTLIDLSHLKKLELIDTLPQDSYPNMAMSFVNLLEQSCNIRSLVIQLPRLCDSYISNMENFCSAIPHHIEHLEIDIGNMNDMKIILERLEHLSSVQFRFLNGKGPWQRQIIEWLSERRDTTHYEQYHSLQIWLGKKLSIPRQMTSSCKRVKFTDYYGNS